LSLPQFQLLQPKTVPEAVDALARHAGEIQVIAGGTDLIPSMRQGLFAPKCVLDIRGIRELRGIRDSDSGVCIGALTPLAAIEHSGLLKKKYSVLSAAASTVAFPVIRNMGTLGGNICLDTRCLWYNQSLAWRKSCGFCIKKDGDLCHVAPGGTKCWAVFSADTPAALLCLDAELEIVSLRGTRRVALADFYADDGMAHVKLKKDELLTRVFLPVASAGLQGAYRKLRVRGSIDYPLAGVAVTLKRKGDAIADVRVAITGVNPAPLVVSGAREALAGKLVCEETAEFAGELAAKTARPLTTSALTPEYRNEMIRVLTKRALLSLN
jgi:4-hydroxybenzoyl-CoA reductase subunit beta